MTLKGWVIYNGHLPGPKFKDFAEWIREAGEKQGTDIAIIPNDHLLSFHAENGPTILQKEKTNFPDFVLYSDKDIPLARTIETMGIPVFNSSHSIELSDNKIETYQRLAAHHLPIPRTMVAPKVFSGSLQAETFLSVPEFFTFPFVVKEAFGSFGEQVYLVHTEEELQQKLLDISNRPFILQEFIETSYGRDLRLNVVGDQVVAAMERTSDNDFRANVSAGGIMKPHTPTAQEKELAIQATKAIGADFAGVDLLFGKDGYPIICEINSNAHIRNIFDCTGINVADYIVSYVLNQVNRGKK
ncbi:RimK family alpha-L-glutamate ligase [Radiobacillus kanasensis]|uniref:ATP-grasp domain-containing protein n=1 Tax=Radiobacillus kanasensis TaxID=2844358 RepID=UPI001E40FB77|nr:RimK family alpha-L-glutamate ligase [Radiobacillus kanasensis]UFT97935.1 RimK family alpha-L-glutamate ligase [Radiobacillus kanasensis]